MPFKPNYNFQKAERDRAKAAKKEQKARERAEAKLRPNGGAEGEAGAEPADAEDADEPASGTPKANEAA